MPKKPKAKQPTQHTPTGIEIPIPSRPAVLRNLEKVAKAGKPSTPAGGEVKDQTK